MSKVNNTRLNKKTNVGNNQTKNDWNQQAIPITWQCKKGIDTEKSLRVKTPVVWSTLL